MNQAARNDADEKFPLGVILAGFATALAMVLGIGTNWGMPQVLERRVEAALITAGYPGVDVDMDGQRAVLAGILESDEDIAAARQAALTAAGPGGQWAGGVTEVDVAGLSVGSIERPYVWTARRDGDSIVLAGAVPSEGVRATLLDTARAAFSGADPTDEMHIAGGAASPAFEHVARNAVRGLARLNTGEARIVDNQVAFIGDGGSEGVVALNDTFAEPPAPFRVRMAVTVDGLDVQHPELQGLNLASGDAETCERAFDRMMERNVVNFAAGSAAIDPSSRRILDALASVALRCDRFRIEVAGHTDNQGARDLNMELSRARADAVANYLAAQGVSRSRLTARGYGPDNPRVSNTTPAGQATNRRIEFYVSS